MSRKKVAVFVPSLEGGGAEQLNTTLANEFAKRELSVDLVVVDGTGRLRRLVADDVRIVVLGSRRCMTSVPHFCRYLSRERPDVVVATMRAGIVALLANRIARGHRRTLVRIESSYTIQYRQTDAVGRSLVRLHAWLLPSADAVVTSSKGAAADIAHLSPKAAAKVRAIYDPIFKPRILDLAGQPVPHRWLREAAVPVVISVGRLSPEKDLRTLLRAFAEVVKARPARLLIVGEGPERAELVRTAEALGIADAVDMPGFQDNPFAFVGRARALVLSSDGEGLPAVLIEALACGTPVVSTMCGSGPKEILEDGKWGRLVPVGDDRAMAEAILQTLDEPADSDALVARAKRFGVEPSVEQHLRLMFPDGWNSPATEATPGR